MDNQQGGRRRPETAIQELLQRARHFTSELKLLLTVDDHSKQSFIIPREGRSAEDLVAKILSTLTHTISLLNKTTTSTNNNNVDSDEVSQRSLEDWPRRCESSSGDSSSKTAASTGSYKKRKTAAAGESWVKESRTLVDDGHAWRKYGHKKILKSEFPRHYYRCSHKFDQKCPATKQVQMVRDRPDPLYRTIYSGRHTCKNDRLTTLYGSKSNEHFLVETVDDDDDGSDVGGHIISFNGSSSKNINPILASFSAATAPMKVVLEQQQQEVLSDVEARCGRQTSPDQPAVPSEVVVDEDYEMLLSLIHDDFDQELWSAGLMGRHL